MNIEIIKCPRCGKRALLFEDDHAECMVCGMIWWNVRNK